MKKIIVIVMVSFIAVPAFSQFISFEQDFRFPTGQKAIPTSQFLWDNPVKGGFSMGPFFLTTPGWNEAFWFFNYNTGSLSFGLGAGVEQLEEYSFRVSPYIKFNPQIGSDSTKTLCFFSLWEIGKGLENYWYTNSVTYESSKVSVGLLARKFYGVGPIFGWKFKAGGWNVKLSGAPVYDLNDNLFKPTVILTVTN